MVNVECINKPESIYLDGQTTTLDISDLSYFDGEQYDLLDEKDFKHYINDLERIVRQSFEYRQLISYLKNTEGMDECSFLENVSSRDNTKQKIEIHHSPLTLFDICLAVFRKRQANREDIDLNSVAEEVMWLHYAGWVGLIPVSATVHDLIHNSYLVCPTDIVRGNYRAFVNAYYNYIEPDTLDALDAAERWAQEKNDGSQMEIFNNHKIYINQKSGSIMAQKPKAKDAIKEHITEVKSGLKVMCRIVGETSK